MRRQLQLKLRETFGPGAVALCAEFQQQLVALMADAILAVVQPVGRKHDDAANDQRQD